MMSMKIEKERRRMVKISILHCIKVGNDVENEEEIYTAEED